MCGKERGIKKGFTEKVSLHLHFEGGEEICPVSRKTVQVETASTKLLAHEAMWCLMKTESNVIL